MTYNVFGVTLNLAQSIYYIIMINVFKEKTSITLRELNAIENIHVCQRSLTL